MKNRAKVLPVAVLLVFSFPAVSSAAWEALPKKAPEPADNVGTPAKIELGRKLFFDPRLSRDGTVSCNSCHNVMAGGEDGRPVSVGINGQKGGRSAPTVWNAAFHSVQFWDGRANTLEDQAKGPITNPIEMGMPSHDATVARIRQIPGYVAEFEKAFGARGAEAAVNIDHVAKAIASYERTLITPNSPYDQYVRGKKTALTAQQIRGMKKVEEIGCQSCHSGPAFNGPLPAGSGVGFYQQFPKNPDPELERVYGFSKDEGRAAITKNPADRHFFRVPTWRNVAVTAPYFHNGAVKDLGEAVRVMAKTQLKRTLTQDETADIVAFLESLTGEFPAQSAPRLPASSGTTLVDP